MNIRRIFRFLVSGGLAALTEYGVFVLLLYMFSDMVIIVPQTISFAMGFVVSFLLNRKWVFKSLGSSKKQVVKYAILALVNLVLGNWLIWLLVELGGIDAYIAKILVMGVVAVWNYAIFARFVFTNK